jgi:hypothetical protein
VVTATPIPEPIPQGDWIELDDISLEFINNTIAANSKYLNQTISIRGEISKIDYKRATSFGLNFYAHDIPTVELVDSGRNRLWCGLDSVDKVGNLSVGGTVIVNGTIIAWDYNLLYVLPCSIVD